MQKIKAIADRYKIQKTLFRVNSYLYAKSKSIRNKVFDKYTLDTVMGCVYVYENQEPGQILKMLLQKFSNTYKISNLIFPNFHVKDNLHDKSVSLFFIGQQIMPLQLFTQNQYSLIDINQMLKFTYDAFCSLHYLHSHDIIHGNIALNTCFISRTQKEVDFALNILDTSTFHQQLLKSNESLIFRSESQQNGLKTSYKDDAQSIIFILLHIISKGKMFSKQRYYQQWMNQNELLRWKSMDFFKQMVQMLPIQLQFLTQMFTIVKSLSRNQKPDYSKFIKKAYSKLKQKQNFDMKTINKKMISGVFMFDQNDDVIQKIQNHMKSQKQKLKIKQKQLQQKQLNTKKKDFREQQEQDQLLKMDSQEQEVNDLSNKFSKLQSTKCTMKTKSFWSQKVKEET